MTTFEFFRFRFHFTPLDPIHFPRAKSANIIRGAFGTVLRQSASSSTYARLFSPGAALGRSPSGFNDWPRPLLFRAAHLDGLILHPETPFFLDVHVFDVRNPVLSHLRDAFAELARCGLGPGRGRARLDRVETLDLYDNARIAAEVPDQPLSIELEPAPDQVARIVLRFVTPTELKSQGVAAAQPDFSVLFTRLRDRLSTLRDLYGPGPLPVDFRALGARAAGIRLTRSDLQWERTVRRSGRTGQVHPLGGFTGEAEYWGDLAEFLPWLHAGRWVGVGRHTVWGKGDFRVI